MIYSRPFPMDGTDYVHGVFEAGEIILFAKMAGVDVSMFPEVDKEGMFPVGIKVKVSSIRGEVRKLWERMPWAARISFLSLQKMRAERYLRECQEVFDAEKEQADGEET